MGDVHEGSDEKAAQWSQGHSLLEASRWLACFSKASIIKLAILSETVALTAA